MQSGTVDPVSETKDFSCSGKNPSQPNKPPRRRKALRLLLLLLGPLVVGLGAVYFYWCGDRIVSTDNAYVRADKVTVSAEVSGPITAVFVHENQQVEAGEPLFTIDDRTYRIALKRALANRQAVETDIRTRKLNFRQKLNELDLAQADMVFAGKEYRRQSSLDSNRAVAKAQFDAARHDLEVSTLQRAVIETEKDQILARLEGSADIAVDRLAEYRLAEAEVEKAELDLERASVIAPFDGIVSKLPQAGKHISPGSAVMSLVAAGNIYVEANLKETELTHVQAGQSVIVTVDSYPGQGLSGIVDSISPATGSEFSIIPAQNASGNWVKVVQRVPVRIRVDVADDREMALRAGLSATVEIDTGFIRPMPAFLSSLCRRLGLNVSSESASIEVQKHLSGQVANNPGY